MCKISDSPKPPQLVISCLKGLVYLFPTARITPTPSTLDKCFKRQDVLELAKKSSLTVQHKPRLGTATEMLRVTLDIEMKLNEWNLPILILHGREDKVTDPECSRLLFEQAKSTDKTLKLYDNSYHCLLAGEDEE